MTISNNRKKIRLHNCSHTSKSWNMACRNSWGSPAFSVRPCRVPGLKLLIPWQDAGFAGGDQWLVLLLLRCQTSCCQSPGRPLSRCPSSKGSFCAFESTFYGDLMVISWWFHGDLRGFLGYYPLAMTNIAMENGHRNSGCSDQRWFSMAMLNCQKVDSLLDVLPQILQVRRLFQMSSLTVPRMEEILPHLGWLKSYK